MGIRGRRCFCSRPGGRLRIEAAVSRRVGVVVGACLSISARGSRSLRGGLRGNVCRCSHIARCVCRDIRVNRGVRGCPCRSSGVHSCCRARGAIRSCDARGRGVGGGLSGCLGRGRIIAIGSSRRRRRRRRVCIGFRICGRVLRCCRQGVCSRTIGCRVGGRLRRDARIHCALRRARY